MRFLRTVSTRRLLATIAGLILAIAGGTAIAVAATGSGPVPAPESLATAIHQAQAAPAVGGLSANIEFTNHLIDSSDLQGTDPILTGAKGRLWLSNNNELRLELQGENGDAQVVLKNGSFWIYDPTSNTVYEGSLPSQGPDSSSKTQSKTEALPTVAQIQTKLNELMTHVNLSSAIPGDIANQPTYTVEVSPRHSGGLLGQVQLAWDAVKGVPLRFAVYANGNGGSKSLVLELKVTHIDYGPSAVSPSDFNVAPPAGAQVVKVATPTGSAASEGKAARPKGKARRHLKFRKGQADVSGVAAVARHLSFPFSPPATLVGQPRQSVTLLDWGGTPAALVTYGQNLGGIAVIERSASNTTGQTPSQSTGGDGHRGLSLPTVSINGATGHELPTAIGTVVTFSRAGVEYIVIGSVPPIAAESAARAL